MDELSTVAAEVLASKATPANEAGSAPRIEVKTLVQDLTHDLAFSDRQLADALNDGWEVLDISLVLHMDTSDLRVRKVIHTRVVTLHFLREPDAGVSVEVSADALPDAAEMLHAVADAITAGLTVPEPALKADDTQVIAPVAQPVLAQDTRPTLRDRDFAFLTAPEPGAIKH